MYKKFAVTMKFRDRLYGGIPRTEKLIDQYVEGKFGTENLDLAEKVKGEMDLIEETERVWSGFLTDENGLYLRDFHIKAMLKQCGQLLGIYTKKRGSKNIVKEGTFIKPVKIYLGREKPDGSEDICGHVMTMQGKRSILKRSDFVAQAEVHFEIWSLDVNKVAGEDFKQMLELGQEVGMGSNRFMESGKFDVTRFEEIGE